MDYPSFENQHGTPIAYVRSVKADSLPVELQEQVKGMEHIFSIHDEEGNVLAVVNNRSRAFSLARLNEFQPVSVH